MRKLFMLGFVVFSILLAPLLSHSFDAVAGRTQSGYGEECQCGIPAPPECYDEITLQRCDTGYGGGGNMAPDGGEGDNKASEVPADYPSGVMLLLVAAYLTSRTLRFP